MPARSSRTGSKCTSASAVRAGSNRIEQKRQRRRQGVGAAVALSIADQSTERERPAVSRVSRTAAVSLARGIRCCLERPDLSSWPRGAGGLRFPEPRFETGPRGNDRIYAPCLRLTIGRIVAKPRFLRSVERGTRDQRFEKLHRGLRGDCAFRFDPARPVGTPCRGHQLSFRPLVPPRGRSVACAGDGIERGFALFGVETISTRSRRLV